MTGSTARIRSELEGVVDACVQCAIGLEDSLIEERDALRRQDSAAILDAASRKNRCMQQMEALDTQRADLSEACGFGRSPADMPSLASALCDDRQGDSVMLNCWNDFLAIARRCFDLNTSNGAIISVRKTQITHSLAAIRGGDANQDSTYGPGGSGPRAEHARSLAEA